MPELGDSVVMALSNEENNEADDKEGHEAAFHLICLREDDWVEWFLRYCCLLLDG